MESQNLKYDSLHEGDQSDSRSSTEVDSLMGDKKLWHDVELNTPIRRTKRNRIFSMLKSSRWIVDTALLLVIAALLVREQWRQPTVLQDPNIWQFGQDFTGVGPKCMGQAGRQCRTETASLKLTCVNQCHPKSQRS